MNIGFFTKTADGTALTGDLPSLHLHGVSFERIAKSNDKAPDYRISIEGAELGAAWTTTSKGGKTTYLRGQIDSPIFPDTVYLAVFTKGEGNYAVVWEREKAKGGATETDQPPAF